MEKHPIEALLENHARKMIADEFRLLYGSIEGDIPQCILDVLKTLDEQRMSESWRCWRLKKRGRTSMEMRRQQQKPSDGLAEQRASNELVKLIRKLRWIGMDEEAARAENQLTLRNVAAADSVVARSRETD
jgi:hypothetical protein